VEIFLNLKKLNIEWGSCFGKQKDDKGDLVDSMAFSKGDLEKLDSRIKNIVEQPVEQVEVSSDLPPTIEDLEDNNKTYAIVAAILFIDIRKSTLLTENSQVKSMVKIYRAFMRMAVGCVRKNGGVTRQFLGDRIMGVFIDSVDDKGAVIERATDKAINAARSLQTAVDYSLNKHLKAKVNGKVIECGIGIDYGKVLVTQVGMYGVEQDEDKENEVDCVWVGNTTNHASKYSDLAAGGEIFISKNVYDQLSDDTKEVWVPIAKCKGTKLFQGYITRDYYLDYAEELGVPTKIEEENPEETDTANQLLVAVKEFERLQNALIQREKELAVFEDRLKRENQNLLKQYNIEKTARIEAQQELNNAKNELQEVIESFFKFSCDIINFAHCKTQYIHYITEDFWNEIITTCFEVGKKLHYTEKEIKSKLDCALIDMYSYYKKYEKAYDVIVIMAEVNPVWIKLDGATLKWAKENYVLHRLQNAIERRLVNYTIANEHRDSFIAALNEVKKMRGV